MKHLAGFIAVLCLAFSACAAPARLPSGVATALQQAGVPSTAVAVTVQEIGASRPALAWNDGEALNPASVMKLLTTFSALEILGPGYRWRTGAWLAGELREGVLEGDLILKGGGDPRLSLEAFWLLLSQLRERGLREIRGRLVLDRSRFDVSGLASAFDEDGAAAYNVSPDALLLNLNVLRVTLVPGDGAARPVLVAVPRLAGMVLENRIALVDGACGEWRDALRTGQGEDGHLILSGTYPRACGEQTWNQGLRDHRAYVGGVFRTLWSSLGGSLKGEVEDGPVPASARLFAVADSPPLAEVIRDINKFSNNVMARQLFLTLGAEGRPDRGRPARQEDGVAAVRSWLDRRGLSFPELVLENGSGLSRRERMSAGSVNRLLQQAWKSPLMPEFVASLPVVAVDGTMQRRLADSGLAGRAHVKTGSLSNVKSIAGYVQARNGRVYSVVFIASHPRAAATRPAQDALLEWVWNR